MRASHGAYFRPRREASAWSHPHPHLTTQPCYLSDSPLSQRDRPPALDLLPARYRPSRPGLPMQWPRPLFPTAALSLLSRSSQARPPRSAISPTSAPELTDRICTLSSAAPSRHPLPRILHTFLPHLSSSLLLSFLPRSIIVLATASSLGPTRLSNDASILPLRGL